MIGWLRLFAYFRRGGMTRRNAFRRVLESIQRDRSFRRVVR